MPLKAILFDLWETLMQDPRERARARQAWRSTKIETVFQRHSLPYNAERITQALLASVAALTELHDTGVDLDADGRVTFFLSYFDSPIELPPEDLAEVAIAITTMPAGIEPILRPDAVATVREIKAFGLSTALVSNAGFTTAPSLRGLLDAFDLSQHLDVLVFSDELKIAKPNPAIFEAALVGLGCEPGDCAFVGDSPHNDIGGAAAAGMLTIQIGERTHDTIKPDILVQTLAELLPALRVLQLVPDSPVTLPGTNGARAL